MPDILVTYALGSCVNMPYDRVARVGGLSHILLLSSKASVRNMDKLSLLIQPYLSWLADGDERGRSEQISCENRRRRQDVLAISTSSIVNIGQARSRNKRSVESPYSIVGEDVGAITVDNVFLLKTDVRIHSASRGEWICNTGLLGRK